MKNTAWLAIIFKAELQIPSLGKKIHSGHRGSLQINSILYPGEVTVNEVSGYADANAIAVVEVRLIAPASDKVKIKEGQKFILYEYPAAVAEGVIKEIISCKTIEA